MLTQSSVRRIVPKVLDAPAEARANLTLARASRKLVFLAVFNSTLSCAGNVVCVCFVLLSLCWLNPIKQYAVHQVVAVFGVFSQ